MASQSGSLVQNLIAGGMAAPLAKLVANAIANANSGQLSKGADAVDGTPARAMRMIDADARRYQFPNLDYSPDKPYQDTLGDSPVQYADATAPHPYQDSQPVKADPPLSQPAIKGGAYVDAVPGVENNASQTVVNLRIKQGDGTHLRLNPATNSIESVPLSFNFPQGIVAGSVSETEAATEITLSIPNQTLLNILAAYNRPVYQCRAWANFSARRTAAGVDEGPIRKLTSPNLCSILTAATYTTTNRFIRGGGNVASILRENTGTFKIVFATPMLTTNYAVLVTMNSESCVTVSARNIHQGNATTHCYVVLSDAGQTVVIDEAEYVDVAVFE
jgi:hypothetical protein